VALGLNIILTELSRRTVHSNDADGDDDDNDDGDDDDDNNRKMILLYRYNSVK
jgi:hypothetical protein